MQHNTITSITMLSLIVVAASFFAADIQSQAGPCENSIIFDLIAMTFMSNSKAMSAFKTACKNQSSTCNPTLNDTYGCGATLDLTSAPVADLAAPIDVEYRRLSQPSSPLCDLYECPPGPCAVFDVDYQTDIVLEPGMAFKSTGHVRCGPSFGVQVKSNDTALPEPAIADLTDTTLLAFPSRYHPGINIYGPHHETLLSNKHGNPGLAPARLKNVVNLNPRWYYSTDMEHEFDGDQTQTSKKNTLCSQNINNPPPHIVDNPVYPWHRATMPNPIHLIGSVDAEAATLDFIHNNASVDIIPQTSTLQNVTDVYYNTCDLSQCNYVPEISGKVNDKKDNPEQAIANINCFFAELMRYLQKSSDLSQSFTNSTQLAWGLPTKCYARGAPPNTIFTQNPTWNAVTDLTNPNTPEYEFHKTLGYQYDPSQNNLVFSFSQNQNGDLQMATQSLKDISHAKFNHYNSWLSASNINGADSSIVKFIAHEINKALGANIGSVQQARAAGYFHDPITTMYKLPQFKCTNKDYQLASLASHSTNAQIIVNSLIAAEKKKKKKKKTQNIGEFPLLSNENHAWMQTCIGSDQPTLECLRKPTKDAQIDSNPLIGDSRDLVRLIWIAAILTEARTNGMTEFSAPPFNYSFDMMLAPTGDELPDTYFRPVIAAVTGLPAYVPVSPLTLNATFLNDVNVAESFACDCGNVPIQYNTEAIPWAHASSYNLTDLAALGMQINTTSLLTVLRESSYGWQHAVGDTRDGMPVGMYLPSPERYGRNFSIYERDILNPKHNATNTSQDLAHTYILGNSVPTHDTLKNDLIFKADSAARPYTQREFVYKHGSCMRPPYGQYAAMEMSAANFTTLFPSCTQNTTDTCHVGDSSLMGYCEKINNKKYPFCANDPLSHKERLDLCNKPRASLIVLAVTIAIRAAQNVCNAAQQICLVFPGEDGNGIDAITTNAAVFGDVTNYTIIVSPFNWSVASKLMAPNRLVYSADSKINLKVLPDNNINITGMQALTTTEFNVLTDQSVGKDAIMTAMDAIVTKLNESKSNGLYDIPSLTDVPHSLRNDAYMFPEHLIAHINVPSNNITVQSIMYNGIPQPIRVATATPSNDAHSSCTVFYVSGKRFSLPPPGLHVNRAQCPKSESGLDAAVVVMGGSDVSNADITIVASGTLTPVIIAGDDTSHFSRSDRVIATNVTVHLPQFNNITTPYAFAAARTSGRMYIDVPQNATAIIQPLQNESCSVHYFANQNKSLNVVNLSAYTSVFGNAVLRLQYPENPSIIHANWILFGFHCAVIVHIVIGGIMRWHRELTSKSPSSYTTRNTLMGTVAESDDTGQSWFPADHMPSETAASMAVETELRNHLRRRHINNPVFTPTKS